MAIRSREIGRAVVSLRTDSKPLVKGLKKARMVMRNFGGSLKSAGLAATTAGASMVGMATAAAAPFALAVRSGMSFHKMMSSVKAITGATGSDFESLRDKAKELGRTTAFTASEVAEGMKFLGMAGFDSTQIEASIGAVLDLAKAGGVELGEAADIASDVGTAFGLGADEFTRVADVIARAATSANTDVLMMGETFKNSAPIAKAAGQSLEEVAAAAGLLGNAGVKAGVAGIDLKNILSAIADDNSRRKIEKYAGSVLDAKGEMLPLMDVLRNMQAGMEGMTGPEKLAAMMDIFGKRSAKSAIILADAGIQVDQMRFKMQNAEGSAAAMAAEMMNNTAGAFDLVCAAIEGVAIAVHDALAPALMSSMKLFASIAERFASFLEKNQTLVKRAAAVVIALGTIGTALVTLGIALGVAGMAVSGLATILGMIATPAGLAVTAVGTIGIAFLALKADVGDLVKAVTNGLDMLMITVKSAASGITDAINADDWKLAGEIAIESLKIAMLQGMASLGISMIAAAKAVMKPVWDILKNPSGIGIAKSVFGAAGSAGRGIAAINADLQGAQGRLQKLQAQAASRSFAKDEKEQKDKADDFADKAWEDEMDRIEAANKAKKEAQEDAQGDFDDAAWNAEMDRIEKAKKAKKEAAMDVADAAWEAEMDRIEKEKEARKQAGIKEADALAQAKLAAEEEANLLANAPDLGQGVFDHRMLQDYTKGIGIPGVQNMLGKPALMSKEEKKEKTQEDIKDGVNKLVKIQENREPVLYEAD